MTEGFAGLPADQQGFAGLREDQQPSNLPMKELRGSIPAEESDAAFEAALADIRTSADQIAKDAVAAERRRLRQQIETKRKHLCSSCADYELIEGYNEAIADILKLLGPEA